MKNRGEYPSVFYKNIVGIVIIFVCAFTYRCLITDNYKINEVYAFSNSNATYIENKVESFITENNETISFFADTFQIDKETLIEQIKENNLDITTINELDPFNTGKEYNSKEEALIEFLLEYESNNSKEFSKKRTSCDKSKDYLIGLIDYYGTIYDNVDTSIAKSIALIESGFTNKYMLDRNNIFGGMSSKGLISYKNIEYGVLKYMHMLSKSYFGKGLDTVSKIGYVFNPTINDNGIKVASPTWVTNVTKYTSIFKDTTVTNLDELLSLV